MTRVLALLLALAASAAQACAVAEGCPMGELPAPVGGCAVVRVDSDHVCIDDPSAPGGVRIEARPQVPDCGLVTEACVRPGGKPGTFGHFGIAAMLTVLGL